MITARDTRLVRVPGLRTLHQVVAALVARLDPATARSTFVLVGSAAAARALRRTLERLLLGGRVSASVFEQLGLAPVASTSTVCLPLMGSRASWLSLLRTRLVDAPPPLDEFSRTVLLAASADVACRAGTRPPFRITPGLLLAMLEFYDTLRRARRSVDDFERLVGGTLAAEAASDRGAARLHEQTVFLTATFREFERRVANAGAIDEHALRARALEGRLVPPVTHLVIAVADAAAEPGGLWPADFDLVARLPGLTRVDLVLTDAMLATGLYERIEQRLPGIRDTRVDMIEVPPALLVPAEPAGRRHFVARDREEELHAVARLVKWDAHAAEDSRPIVPDDTTVVVARPLPYLYLARHVLDGSGIPWTAADALPLAAEPYAAWLDLVTDAVTTGFDARAVQALLRHAWLRPLTPAGQPPSPDEVRALAREVARLGGRATDKPAPGGIAIPGRSIAPVDEPASSCETVAESARRLLDVLGPLTGQRPMSALIDAWLVALDHLEHRTDDSAEGGERGRRARHAIRSAMRQLRDAAAAYHDPVTSLGEVWALLRGWIEARTFRPQVGEQGVHLLDVEAARFADTEALWILGLVEGDWTEAGRRHVLYPASLVDELGWPRETDRVLAGRAVFLDLLRLPGRRIALSSFTLEDDAIVQPSVLLEELDGIHLPVAVATPPAAIRVHVDEAIALDPVIEAALAPTSQAWLAWRIARATLERRRFQGFVPAGPAGPHAVTHVDRWIDCPFQYFARHVLELEEASEDEDSVAALERGVFVHRVFQAFFRAWEAEGHAAITLDNIGRARQLLAATVAALLPGDGTTAAWLDRQRLLGSAVAVGYAERVFRWELERAAGVVRRELETPLDGTYTFTGPDGLARRLTIRAQADRIDLLEGRRFAVVDYKTGRAPAPRSVQLPIYAHVIRQRLAARDGAEWEPDAADYLAMRGRAVTAALGRDATERARRLAEAQAGFVAAVEAIARGEFPPRPADRRLCGWCPYDAVCRKDYVTDEPA